MVASRLLGLVAVVVTVAAVIPAAPAQATLTPIGNCPELHYCTTTWYVDSSRTYVAGRRTVDCAGHLHVWGRRTMEEKVVQTAC